MTTPAGWYDDPEDPNSQRYWDGQSWTPHRAQKRGFQQGVPPPTAPPPSPALGQQPQWVPPGQPPGGMAPRRSRTPLLIGIALAVLAAIVGVVVLMFVLNTKTVDAASAAKAIADAESAQTGFTPTDVKCPSGVDAKVGATFNCQFTGPDGPYTAYMTVTKVDGDRVEFSIKARLSSAGPPG